MANRTWYRACDVEDEDEAETIRKGPWTVEEDMQLTGYIRLHGEGRWNFIAKATGLKRTGRSCRLRWANSLRPGLKRSKITSEEERLIIKLHGRWGNRWSHIAQSLPGRTDNEIKNYWRTRIKGNFMNLQDESGSCGMDTVDNPEHFERSLDSCCLPASSQRLPDHDSAAPSTSFPAQSTEEGEDRHGPSQANDDGQPGEASHQDLEVSENQLFENSILCNFSVGSLESLLNSSEFYVDGATQDGHGIPPCFSYMVASPEVFSDSGTYLNRYSDVLWNMDEDDDRFNGSKHHVSRNDRRSY